MSTNPAEDTAITPASVKPGMGYPNDRVEVSPSDIGWQGLDQGDVRIVSRETSESQ
jgi:hypothetical protein